eukprot:scaffold870_cov268-Pinguiococcus_pyrenoidosus.AAC.84
MPGLVVEVFDIRVVVAAVRAAAVDQDAVQLVDPLAGALSAGDLLVDLVFALVAVNVHEVGEAIAVIFLRSGCDVHVEVVLAFRSATSLPRRVLLGSPHEGIHVQRLREGEAIVELDSPQRLQVVIEAHELHGEQQWQLRDSKALLRSVLRRASLTEHLVLPVQMLRLQPVVASGGSKRLEREAQVQERVGALRLVAAVVALAVVDHGAFVEVLDDAVLPGVTERVLQSVQEDPQELLDVLLLEGIVFRPTERLRQRLRGHEGVATELQRGEEPLQMVRHALISGPVLLLVVLICIHGRPELRRHEESLQQAVHVARCTLVREADVLPIRRIRRPQLRSSQAQRARRWCPASLRVARLVGLFHTLAVATALLLFRESLCLLLLLLPFHRQSRVQNQRCTAFLLRSIHLESSFEHLL